MRVLRVLSFLFLISYSLLAQDLSSPANLAPEDLASQLPQVPKAESLQKPVETSTPSPEKTSDETSDFYSYTQTLEDYRGLQVTTMAGYRIPKISPLEAGFELILTFKNTNPDENQEFKTLGNQAILQIYAPRSGLLRYRVTLTRDQESSENEIVYRATEQQDPFFLRFLNELEGGRTAQLFLTQSNSNLRVRVNFSLNLSPLQDLWKFSQNLPQTKETLLESTSPETGSPSVSPLP